MTSYNLVNGVHAHENKTLLDILKNEWGFSGLIMSDWGGTRDIVESIKAGSHLEMPGTGGASALEILRALDEGRLTVDALDDRLGELLSAIFAVRELKTQNTKSEWAQSVLFNNSKVISSDIANEHHDISRRAAGESIVLLKNADHILPLKPEASVAVVGDFAEKPRYQGAGSSLVNAINVSAALSAIHNYTINFIGYEKGFCRTGGNVSGDEINKMQELISKADVVLLYMGLDEINESEGIDRDSLSLKNNQIKTLRRIARLNKNIIVILHTGSVVDVSWIDDCKALLLANLGGEAGAEAVLDVITGLVNPCGKLTETWPLSLADTPTGENFPSADLNSEYSEGMFVGYRHYDKNNIDARFPFGFGMSYTDFVYSNLVVENDGVSFTIKNVGQYDGKEISQLYIGKTDSFVTRAKKELKGFNKIFLQSGESKTVTIPFNEYSFRYFNVNTGKFEIEDGDYEIYIGASIKNIVLSGTIHIHGIMAEEIYGSRIAGRRGTQTEAPADKVSVRDVLNTSIPGVDSKPYALLTRESLIAHLIYAKSFIARLAAKILIAKIEKQKTSPEPDINLICIYDMPLRGIVKMTGGQFDNAMLDALLSILNGHFFKGAIELIKAKANLGRQKKHLFEALMKAATSP
jgi:beta-glucosidase